MTPEQIKAKIEAGKSFKSGNLHAAAFVSKCVIYSYATIIAEWVPGSKTYWMNPKYYSVTTARQKSKVRKTFRLMGVEEETNESNT